MSEWPGIGFGGDAAIVILSPHGEHPGVYREVRGSLADFGIAGVEVARPTDDALAADLAKEWSVDLIDPPADHGIVVPLRRMAGVEQVPVVAATLPDITAPDPTPVDGVLDHARRFATSLAHVADGRTVFFIASGHTSAALSDRAPLTFRDEGPKLVAKIERALETDVGALDEIDPRLWIEAGACGAGPLTAFGKLFAGRPARVLLHEWPLGVGYLIAVVT